MADTIAKLIFEANTAQLKKAQDELDKLTAAAGKAGKKIPGTTTATDKLSDAFRNASTATATLTGPLNGLSGRLSFIATGLNRIGAGGLITAASFAGLTFAVKNSVQVFSDFEMQMNKLESLVKSTGFTSGFTAKQLDQMAREMARNTLASASQMREAQGVLLTFKSISGEAFKTTLGLTQDIGAVMGTTAVSGAKQLGKALEDPARNLTALTRAGISFTEEETNKIKVMQQSGDLAGAQALILQTLTDQVGGAGGGGGLSAATDLLADNFVELQIALAESTGAADLAEKGALGLANAFASLRDAITETNEAELERLKNQKESRSKAGNEAREARIKELEDLIADEAKKQEIAKKAAEDEKQRRADAEAAKLEQDQLRRSIEFAQLQEHNDRMQGFHEDADLHRLDAERMQADLEKMIAQEKYGELEALNEIHKQKMANIDTKANIDRNKRAAKLAKLEKKRREDSIKQLKGMLSEAAQHNKKAFELNKAVKIGETIVETGKAAMSAYASLAPIPFVGPALGAAAAAAAIAMGAIQIKAIKSATFQGGGSVASGSAGSAGGAGMSGSSAANTAPLAPEIPETPSAPSSVINVTINDSIDPGGARRIVEALNEATEDGLEINALVA